MMLLEAGDRPWLLCLRADWAAQHSLDCRSPGALFKEPAGKDSFGMRTTAPMMRRFARPVLRTAAENSANLPHHSAKTRGLSQTNTPIELNT